MTNQMFDYVVVGGGASGAVVAARLSEDPKISVALIEAGPSELILKKIWEFFKPAAVPLLVVACLYFWVNNITSNITNISEDVTNRIEKIQEIHDEEMKKVLDANRQERIEHENNIKKLQKLNCKNLISKSNFYNFEIKIQFL